MVDYSVIESAVVQRVRQHFNTELSESRCKATDIDAVFAAMVNEDADYGCVLDYSDGRRMPRPPFNSDVWVWQVLGMVLIRYRGDVEAHDMMARQVIDKLVHLFDNDKRLGGLVPLAQITQIGKPEAEAVNEVPMYWIPFSIEVIDK